LQITHTIFDFLLYPKYSLLAKEKQIFTARLSTDPRILKNEKQIFTERLPRSFADLRILKKKNTFIASLFRRYE